MENTPSPTAQAPGEPGSGTPERARPRKKRLWRRAVDRIPFWSQIGVIGQNPVVKTSYLWLLLVPLVAKLLEAADRAVKLRIFGADVQLALHLPFRLVMFYSAALAFTAGAVVFAVFCPGAIKRYKSYAEFERTGIGDDILLNTFCGLYQKPALLWPLPFEDSLRDFFLDKYTDFHGDKGLMVRGTSDRAESILSARILPDKRAAAFWFVSHNVDRIRPLHRLAATLFFAVGFVCLAVVLYQNAETVWRLS